VEVNNSYTTLHAKFGDEEMRIHKKTRPWNASCKQVWKKPH
jgi:hypothetical protein